MGLYSSIILPTRWGGGGESKGLRAREEIQRRVKKMEGLGGGEEEKNFGGLSYLLFYSILG